MNIPRICTEKAIAVMKQGPSTLESEIGRLIEDYPIPQGMPVQISSSNVPVELLEKAPGARYPAVHVYCERVNNTLKQRFNRFSGTARMVASVRVSHDRWEQVEPQAALLVEALTNLLEGKRGDWSDGVYYAGAYEVSFTPLKAGGRNYMQTASVAFDLDVVRS